MKFVFYYDPEKYWLRRGQRYMEDAERRADIAAQRKNLADALERLKFRSALEVGCGYGGVLKALRSSFPSARLSGIDFSESMISKSKEILAGLKASTSLAKASEIPFGDESFDVVFSVTALLHVPDGEIKKVAKEMGRVSRKYIVVVEPDANRQGLLANIFHSRHVFLHDYTRLFCGCRLVFRNDFGADTVFVFEKNGN